MSGDDSNQAADAIRYLAKRSVEYGNATERASQRAVELIKEAEALRAERDALAAEVERLRKALDGILSSAHANDLSDIEARQVVRHRARAALFPLSNPPGPVSSLAENASENNGPE